MAGFIKLHRCLLDNPIVCKDGDHFSIWCYLLLNATHNEIDVVFSNERIKLKPGQLITGRKTISEKFKISESKVQRILKKFEIEHQIEQQTSSKNRLISIINWEIYQTTNSKTTTSEQQVNTNKNVKNVNNNIYADIDEIRKKYPGTKSKAKADKKLPDLIKKYGKEQLIRTIERYIKFVESEHERGFQLNYKNESTYWNGGYLDYLDINYEEAEPKPKPTSTVQEVVVDW